MYVPDIKIYRIMQQIFLTDIQIYRLTTNYDNTTRSARRTGRKNGKEERELAISLAEVLRTPIMASPAALVPPTPTSEKAVGLERFWAR
jgi:hypothetical protein